jgi:quercetin dioxygenase-like cupin family protein
MLSRRSLFIRGMGVCLFFFFVTFTPSNAADTISQIVAHVDEILKENPLKAGEQIQLITIAQDDTITLIVGRIIEGAQVKPHFHKTHDETVYVIKGTGQVMVNDQWVDLKPGSVHFNPMTKVFYKEYR